MALATSLVACGSGSGTESSGSAAGSTAGSTSSSGEKRALCMGTGSSSGAWYIIGGGMSNAVNLNSSQFTITNEASSGGGENLRNLQEGNVDIVTAIWVTSIIPLLTPMRGLAAILCAA